MTRMSTKQNVSEYSDNIQKILTTIPRKTCPTTTPLTFRTSWQQDNNRQQYKIFRTLQHYLHNSQDNLRIGPKKQTNLTIIWNFWQHWQHYHQTYQNILAIIKNISHQQLLQQYETLGSTGNTPTITMRTILTTTLSAIIIKRWQLTTATFWQQ